MIQYGRTGQYTEYAGVKCFSPKLLPPDPPLNMSDELIIALSSADRALARLDGTTTTLPNPGLFVFAFMRQEAVLSSQIEGTQASLDDLLEYEAAADLITKSDDLVDVVNYLDAIRWGLAQLPVIPLSLRLIKEIHRRLLAEGRGSERSPGAFRNNQNWIGPPGCTIEDATFVPPAVPIMESAIGEWEKFLHAETRLPPLIKCALAHAQFVTIHPFWDGNGRLGRMIVTLMLCAERILAQPVLYLSLFFKQHRDDYYGLLQRTRDEGDWESWVLFFLRGVTATSRAALKSAHAINALRETLLKEVGNRVRSNKAPALVDRLFHAPYMTIKSVAQELDVSFPTASKLVDEFERQGYLLNIRESKRDRIYAFRPYLDILHENVDDLTAVISGEDYLVTVS